ncbi:Ca2+-binding EF-hand superfamily protein [Catalinimonas alkaloidigena]|uniref:hypothetical protein n=1 Tax=Catalinimonas alkaloidigena TaxID=1075417 RepID=UPI0024052C01|nr:hypothetical protein [Catalinimonas alkaloidigena]MDF9799303.1 Ca2+-binding EF-hand superfamily protein [Catalinimonas alkaloidigena]
MKKTVKTIALGAIAFMVLACASQNNQANNPQRPSGRQGGGPSFAQLLSEMDVNKDGKLAKSEVKGPLVNDFSKIDADSDGFLIESELENAPRPQRNGPRP